MILGNWAILLNLISMAALLVLILAAVQLLLVLPVRWLCGYLAPQEQKYLLLGWASLPWLSPLPALFLGMSSSSLIDGTLKNPALDFHWHHADWFVIDSWHVLPMILVTLWLGLGMSRSFIRTLRHNRQHKQLLTVSVADKHIPQLSWLPTERVFAFTSGLFKPEVFLSYGLKKHLTPVSLDIVLAHEQAHVRHADSLTRWMMSGACGIWPCGLARPLFSRYVLVTEQLADSAAARFTDVDATEVASTLVQMARLSRDSTQLGNTNFFAPDEPHQLHERVNQLLSPVLESIWLKAGLLVMLLLIVVGSVASIDGLHHGIELLLGHG